MISPIGYSNKMQDTYKKKDIIKKEKPVKPKEKFEDVLNKSKKEMTKWEK